MVVTGKIFQIIIWVLVVVVVLLLLAEQVAQQPVKAVSVGRARNGPQALAFIMRVVVAVAVIKVVRPAAGLAGLAAVRRETAH